jgi:sugar phosphate isomerase/epimerase
MKTYLTRSILFATVVTAFALHTQPARAQSAPSTPNGGFGLVGTTGGFVVGCAAYTFRQGTAFEAIDKTKACGGKVIEFFAWQKLSAETGDVKLDENLSDENIKRLKAKLDDAGIQAVNCYVNNAHFAAGNKDESGPRKVFEFARKLGLRGLTGEPPEDQLDIVEKLAKEYDIQFCFHNHPKDEKKPDYRNWEPAYVLSLVKNRDRHIGVCVDTGHLVRSGIKPVDAIKTLGNRVLSAHLKDLNDWKPDAIDQPYGQGVADIKGVLAELKRVGFKGHIAIEYENTTDHLLDDVKQCIEFVRVEGGKLPAAKKKAAKAKTR